MSHYLAKLRVTDGRYELILGLTVSGSLLSADGPPNFVGAYKQTPFRLFPPGSTVSCFRCCFAINGEESISHPTD